MLPAVKISDNLEEDDDIPAAPAVTANERGICPDWWSKGSCTRGVACAFDHPVKCKGDGKNKDWKGPGKKGKWDGKAFNTKGPGQGKVWVPVKGDGKDGKSKSIGARPAPVYLGNPYAADVCDAYRKGACSLGRDCILRHPGPCRAWPGVCKFGDSRVFQHDPALRANAESQLREVVGVTKDQDGGGPIEDRSEVCQERGRLQEREMGARAHRAHTPQRSDVAVVKVQPDGTLLPAVEIDAPSIMKSKRFYEAKIPGKATFMASQQLKCPKNELVKLSDESII